MHERWPRHPAGIAAAFPLIDEELRHDRIVDRLFARDFRRHELEFIAGVSADEVRLNEDPFSAVLRRADGDEIALTKAASLLHPERAVTIEDECGIHARLARQAPLALDADVGRQIGRRKESVRQHAIRRRGDESRVGGRGQLWAVEVRSGEWHMAEDKVPYRISAFVAPGS